MDGTATLGRHLEQWARANPQRLAVKAAVEAVADAGVQLAKLIAEGPGQRAVAVGANTDGDTQVALDVLAHDLVVQRLAAAGVAACGSEEAETAEPLNPDGLVAVAVDPLDGSSNIETNAPVGTIFSVLPLPDDGSDPFLKPGQVQLASGYIIYGPATDLVLTVREGTHVFTLDRDTDRFRMSRATISIPAETAEFAINMSNYRHWYEGIRQYIDDCLAGVEGPREKNFNMRWVASLVAEASRIFARGGIFLYPRDRRKGYGMGRLRLVYEANPIALLVEQAGGRATSGFERILDIVPASLHQRTPLIFGAAREVLRVEKFKAHPDAPGEHSPLFANRGLFRE